MKKRAGRSTKQAGGGAKLRERISLLAPFVVGGLAALWLIRSSDEPVVAGAGWLVSAIALAIGFLLLTTAPAASGPFRDSRVRRERIGSRRWEARPVGSLVVRVLAVLGPIGVSLATALAIQGALPAPDGGLEVAAQAVLLMAVAFAVLYAAERATRKLAPVAMLLKLSLSFPSAAPSRFVVARRSANVTSLKRDLEEGRHDPAGTMLSLVAALTAHDARTRGHSERVRVFSEMLAQELELEERDREHLRWAALLHDIGKLSVSASILNKPAKLDASQWEAMHKHPVEGARLIAPIASWLGEWADGVAQHHERLDGSGYPKGLREGEISLAARIIAVADAYDTMVTPRTYHRPIAASAAREEVVRSSGFQFDPLVVRALLSLSIPKLWWRIGLGAWLATLPLLRPITPKGSGTSAGGAASGVANVVGIVSIAVAAVIAPLGSIQNGLPQAPGLAAEASTPDGTTPSQPGDTPTASPDSPPSEEGPQALGPPAPAGADAPAAIGEEPGKAGGAGACQDQADTDDDVVDPDDVGPDPDDADDADSACGDLGGGADDGVDDGVDPGVGVDPGTGSSGGTSDSGTVVEANQDATTGSGGTAGGGTGSGTTGGSGSGTGSTSGGGTSSEANSDATFPSPSPP